MESFNLNEQQKFLGCLIKNIKIMLLNIMQFSTDLALKLQRIFNLKQLEEKNKIPCMHYTKSHMCSIKPQNILMLTYELVHTFYISVDLFVIKKKTRVITVQLGYK